MKRPPSRTNPLKRLIPIIVVLVFICIALNTCSSNSTDKKSNNAPKIKTTAAGNTAKAYSRTEEERTRTSNSLNTTTPGERVVYLTFDDGPSSNTHKILGILNEYQVCATWFIKGQSNNIDYLKDIWAAGNQIAIHTNTHNYTEVYASTDAYWHDVEACGSAIESRLGFKPSIVRFPGGSKNSYNKHIDNAIISAYPERGYHYFDWNVSSGDGANHTAEEITNYVINNASGCNSCCVLMHDSSSKNSTVEALPAIIEWFIDNGYTFDVLLADSYGYHF